MRVCQHCNTSKANRPRGLCWTCYYTPGVRDKYGVSQSKYARRGSGNGGGYALPADPTDAPVGSEEKIAVLSERAERGEQLFHPLDTNTPFDVTPCIITRTDSTNS